MEDRNFARAGPPAPRKEIQNVGSAVQNQFLLNTHEDQAEVLENSMSKKAAQNEDFGQAGWTQGQILK